MSSLEPINRVRIICLKIIQNPENVSNLKDLLNALENVDLSQGKIIQQFVLSTFYPIIKSISEDKCTYREDDKRLLVDILKNLFDKSIVDKLPLFFNIYALLLFEIYDAKQHTVLDIHEEYKLSIIRCMISLSRSVSSDLLLTLYSKQNATKLCQMLYVCIELAKNEKFRNLRISAMECIMTLAHVSDEDDFNDVVLRNQIAEVFLFFLPGLACGLRQIALEDEKVGHKIPAVAVRTWGRIVSLIAQDYDNIENPGTANIYMNSKSSIESSPNQKFTDSGLQKPEELKHYIQKTTRSHQWYAETDRKLQGIVVSFKKLTHYSSAKVRMELVNASKLLINNCLTTLPLTSSHMIEIIITLSEDDEPEISGASRICIEELSSKLSKDDMKSLLENLEESFYNTISSLPRKFNAIDEREQLAALNLLIGYMNVFGKYRLSHVLLSATHLQRLLSGLIHICQMEKKEISLLEEYIIQDLDALMALRKTPWKKFVYFTEEAVKNKIEVVCYTLAKHKAVCVTVDYLLDVYSYEPEHRKEAIFIMNSLFTDVEIDSECMNALDNIIRTYIDKKNWYLPLAVMIDDLGYEHNLSEIQDNIIQVCLLVEGIGKFALFLRDKFSEYLLRTLHLVLERAGSAQPLIQAAGLMSLSNIASALSYSGITQLIMDNMDFIQHHLERRLRRLEENESVLDVLAVILKYSTMEALPSDVIQEVLIYSCDKYKEKYCTSFLVIFKMYITCLHRLMNIVISVPPLKTKKEKQEELEDFKVTGINYGNDFSDDIMGKSAEEMYKEDMERKQQQTEEEISGPEVEEYKKPEPPHHIKLAVSVLMRSLHFLPSKDKTKRLLVLEILTKGIEVLKDYEDELLPIVHQIWSPLVDRFRPSEEHLIINLSVKLLAALSRLSKEFIRSRTVKDVLPNLVTILSELSKESYLKDKGSVYRYSQTYKLQLAILENLPMILIDLDILEEHYLPVLKAVFKYLSDKQPLPLKEAAVDFFRIIDYYDPTILKDVKRKWLDENVDNEYSRSLQLFIN